MARGTVLPLGYQIFLVCKTSFHVSQGGPQTHYAAKNDLDLPILQFLAPKCWDFSVDCYACEVP